MKTVLKLVAAAAILVPVMYSCSGSTGESSKESVEQKNDAASVESEAPATMDVDRIVSMKDKNGKLSESDYDFLLDQVELVGRSMAGMSAEERKAYMKNLDKQSQEAIFVMAFILEASSKKGLMTERQQKRYQELEEKYD